MSRYQVRIFERGGSSASHLETDIDEWTQQNPDVVCNAPQLATSYDPENCATITTVMIAYKEKRERTINTLAGEIHAIFLKITGPFDDGGCDIMTYKGLVICAGNPKWIISDNPEAARLLNAYHALVGYEKFINVSDEYLQGD